MKKASINLAKNITRILSEFNFEIVLKVVHLLDIEFSLDEPRLLEISDIKTKAEELLWEVVEKAQENNYDFYFIESNYYLRAEYHKTEKDGEWVVLYCQIERSGDD